MNPQQSTGAKLKIATLKGAVPGRAPGPLSPTKSRTAQSRKAINQHDFGDKVCFSTTSLSTSTTPPRNLASTLPHPTCSSRSWGQSTLVLAASQADHHRCILLALSPSRNSSAPDLDIDATSDSIASANKLFPSESLPADQRRQSRILLLMLPPPPQIR